jgi:hypothetical protein
VINVLFKLFIVYTLAKQHMAAIQLVLFVSLQANNSQLVPNLITLYFCYSFDKLLSLHVLFLWEFIFNLCSENLQKFYYTICFYRLQYIYNVLWPSKLCNALHDDRRHIYYWVLFDYFKFKISYLKVLPLATIKVWQQPILVLWKRLFNTGPCPRLAV